MQPNYTHNFDFFITLAYPIFRIPRLGTVIDKNGLVLIKLFQLMEGTLRLDKFL